MIYLDGIRGSALVINFGFFWQYKSSTTVSLDFVKHLLLKSFDYSGLKLDNIKLDNIKCQKVITNIFNSSNLRPNYSI